MTNIKTVAIVGTGVIGAGWATRCLARGIDVVATDPGPDAEAKLRASLENARPAAEKLYGSPDVAPGTLTVVASVEEAVANADFIQENAPEREDLKRKLHAQIDAAARPDVIIASSSSGLMPTAIQADCKHPERVLIGHPFNPVYLLPLCEVVGGSKTAPENIKRAMEFYTSIGMYALHVRKEIEGYLSDRLQEAIWREILHLVNDGVATTGELDDAIKYGPGLRWAIMGTNLIFHMAGGDTGMRHMLHQFGPALKLPWTKLEAPELTDELIDRMVEGTHEQAGGKTVKELEQLRDNCLIDIMRTLQKYEIASGKVLADDEARRKAGG
jgi:carnitine 3-dehydrogenase